MVRSAMIVVAFAVLAAGCASRGAQNIDPGYRLTTKGVLVASLTASGYSPPGRLSYLIVRPAEPSRVVAAVALNDEMLGFDWQLGDLDVEKSGYGRLAVVELAPGEYELRRGFIYVSPQETYTSARVLGYRFTIAPGKATYLGNVHVDIASTGGKILAATDLKDRRSRDLPILHRKYSGIRAEQVLFPAEMTREAALQRAADGAPTKLEDLQHLLPGR